MRCYLLVKEGIASMWELKNVYTLDEMLKLYALYKMGVDIENAKAEEMAND